MRIVSAHKVLAAIIGALVLVALCAGMAMAVTTATNNHNAAVQRAAAQHRAIVVHNDLVARAQARAIALAQARAARAEREARQARRAARRAVNRPNPAPVVVVPGAPAAATPSSGLSPVGTGTNGEEVYANSPPTSTPFALNVESDYWNTPGMTFTSYSPVTGLDYNMTATDNGSTVIVTNAEGCVIQFSDS
jgi:hypothetical protein